MPNPNGLPYVNHKDGIKTNNQASNLEWCTAKQNTAHAIALGLHPVKSNRRFSKEDIAGIRQLRKQGLTYKAIAEKYNANWFNIKDAILYFYRGV